MTITSKISFAALLAFIPAYAWADPASLMIVVGQFLVVKGVELAVIYAGYALVAAGIIYGTTSKRRAAKKSAAAARDAYNASLGDRGANIISGIPPWRIVYGRATVGASIHAMFTTDKISEVNGETVVRKDALHYLVYVFAAHECAQLHDVKIDGVSAGPFDASGWSLNSEYRNTESRTAWGEVTLAPGQSHTSDKPFVNYWAQELNALTDYARGQYPADYSGSIGITNGGKTATNNHATLTLVFSYTFFREAESSFRFLWHAGSDTQVVDPVLHALFPDKWTTNHRIRGRAYAVVMVDIEDPKFQGGPPQLTADVTGKLVYDPRNTTTAGSSNNALCIRDFLLAKWGANASATEVNDTYTAAAANACDVSTAFETLTFNSNVPFDFSASTGGCVGYQTTVTWLASPGRISVETLAPGGYVTKDGMSFSGAINRYVRFQMKRVAGEGWTGKLYYKTASHDYSEDYRKDVSAGFIAGNPPTELLFDMHSLTFGKGDWKDNVITGLRFVFGSEQNDKFEIYSIALGWFYPTTTMQPKYTLNGTFTTDDNREAVLEDMAASMNGFVTNSGSWLIVAGSWTAPVRDFDDNDLDGQISLLQTDTGLEELANSAKGTYYPIGASSPVEFEAYKNATLVTADGEELWLDFALPFTSEESRARNLARGRVERTRSGQILSIPLKLHAWNLQVGDRIRQTSTEYGLSLKVYRITDWSFSLTGAVLVTAQEDIEEIYDEADTTLSDPTPNTDLPNPNVVQGVENLAATSGTSTLTVRTDGTVHARVKLTWDVARDAYLVTGSSYLEISWRRVGADPVTMSRTLRVSAMDTAAYLEEVGEYDVLSIGARYVNSLGRTGASSYIQHVVVGKSEPPSIVTGLTGTVSQGIGVLVWDTPPDLDYDVTELRLDGTSWANATQFFKGRANTYSQSVLAAGSYVIRAKHIDTSGNYSVNEASFTLVVAEEDLGGGQYTEYLFGRFTSPPSAPTETDPTETVPPVWFDAPPTTGDGPLYTTIAKKYGSGALIGTWSDPVQIEASEVKVEYSEDGATSWHPTFTAGDLYAQYSTDGGSSWTDPIKIVGEDGTSVVIKGSVPTVGDLPVTADPGDLYVVTASSDGYVWNGASWDNVGPIRGPAGNTGNYFAYVFKRSAAQPDTPVGDPPTGWDDEPPVPDGNPLWASLVEKTYLGVPVGTYSPPVQIEGAGVTVEYSVDGATGWHSTYASTDIYAQYSTDGGSTWEGPVRIVGEDGISASMSNGAHVFPATDTGFVTSYVNSGTELRVYEGGELLDYDGIGTANGKWRVLSKTGINITPGATINAGAYALIDVHQGVSDGTDTASVTYTLSGKTNRGASFTIPQVQTFTKSKSGVPGIDGDDAKFLGITVTAPAFTFDGAGAASPVSQTITISAVLQNLTGGTVAVSGERFNASGASLGAATLGGSGATRTLTVANFGSAAYCVFTATYTGGYIATTLVSRVQNGAPGGSGTRGSVDLYVLGSTALTTVEADAAILAQTGSSTKVTGDMVTEYDGSTYVDVLRWNGTAWVDPGQVIDSDMLVNGKLTAAKIAANTITGDKIAANTITTTNLAADSITTANLAAGAVTAAKISVTTLQSVSSSTGSLSIATGGSILSGQSAYDTGTGFWLGSVSGVPKFSIGSATKALLWDGTSLTVRGKVITSENVVDGTLVAGNFATSIEPVGIVAGSVLPTTKSTNNIYLVGTARLYRWSGTAYVATVPSTDITGTLTNAQIADLAATKITGTLTNTQIADLAATKITGTLSDAQIAALAAAKLTGQIVTTQITDDAVTTAKVAAGAITTAELAAGAVTAAKITAGTITANELAANSVTASEISAGAVTTAKVAAGAITTTELAAGAVTAAKIAAGTITANELAANSITAGKIAAAAVSASNISVTTLSAISADLGTVTAGTIDSSGYVRAAGAVGTGVPLEGVNITLTTAGAFNPSRTQESALVGLSSTAFRPALYGHNSNTSSGFGVGGQGFIGVFGQANNVANAIGGKFVSSAGSYATTALYASTNLNTGSIALKAQADAVGQKAGWFVSADGTALDVDGTSTFSSTATFSAAIVSNRGSGDALTVARPIASTLANGTAPFVVISSTRVANLNVASAGNADTVNSLGVAWNQNWWSGGKIAVIANDGVLEGMKYLDFHNASTDNNATIDYSVRLHASGGTATGNGYLRVVQTNGTANVDMTVLAGIDAGANHATAIVNDTHLPGAITTDRPLKWMKAYLNGATIYIPYVSP